MVEFLCDFIKAFFDLGVQPADALSDILESFLGVRQAGLHLALGVSHGLIDLHG